MWQGRIHAMGNPATLQQEGLERTVTGFYLMFGDLGEDWGCKETDFALDEMLWEEYYDWISPSLLGSHIRTEAKTTIVKKWQSFTSAGTKG